MVVFTSSGLNLDIADGLHPAVSLCLLYLGPIDPRLFLVLEVEDFTLTTCGFCLSFLRLSQMNKVLAAAVCSV